MTFDGYSSNKDFEVTVQLPRRKPFKKLMHKVVRREPGSDDE